MNDYSNWEVEMEDNMNSTAGQNMCKNKGRETKNL